MLSRHGFLKRSPKHRPIEVLAARWVTRRFGSDDKYGTKARNREAIAAYMRNWLAQHGRLPSGTHKVKLPAARRLSDGVYISRAAMPWRIVDFDRLLQGDLHYPESYSAEVHRLRALRPGDRVEFRCLLPEERKRHGAKGTVVELDIPKGWAVVNLDNGEKGVCASGEKLFKLAAAQWASGHGKA